MEGILGWSNEGGCTASVLLMRTKSGPGVSVAAIAEEASADASVRMLKDTIVAVGEVDGEGAV